MDEQALSELLECSVCLERLNHTSKVLPCQHTFCRRCLEEIVSTQQELRCPECRTLVTTRVEDLPPNILLVRLLEGLKTQGHVLSSKPASYQRKRDTSVESRQPSRPGWESPQPCARALYSYEASEKDDLTFKKGDMVMLRRQIDDNWYQGELNGQIGVFPASYVQVLVPLPQIPQCRALYDFQLNDENEKDCLTFKKDEVITVIRRVDTNWIEGRKSDKIGILPLAFVELNHAAKTLISSKPPSLSMFHGQPTGSNRTSNATTTSATSLALSSSSTTTTSTITTATTTTTAPVQPPRSPASVAWHSSRASQQKRHSFTPKSDSPSPPPQAQRHSLELGGSSGNENSSNTTAGAMTASTIVTSSSTAVPAVMSASMPASMAVAAGLQDRMVPLPKSSAPASNGAPTDPLPTKASSGSSASSAASSSGAVSLSGVSTPIYIAMYNYWPQKEDEVELRKGDYYTVTEKCQDGWFKGQCLRTSISGVFPGNYVQLIRTASAFKPVNPNVLNIRAKAPSPHNHHQHHHSSSRPYPDNDSNSASPPIPPHIKTSSSSSSAAPPLVPRVARMSPSSSPSSVSGRHSPHSSSHSSKSISNTHVPVTITGGRSSHASSGSSILSSVMRSMSAPGGSPSESSHRSGSGSGASGHISRASSSSSSSTKLSVESRRRTSSPHGALLSVQHSMSTSTNITPPNVVMGPAESSSSQLALISKDREKREKREKEKKGLVKLLAGKSKKSKTSSSDTTPSHLSADAVAHTRSGSYPSEHSSPGSPREISQHRKTASLDSSTSPSSKSRSKPQVRERYRCIVPYPPQTEHELELELGDIVHVHKRREDGWFKGTQERTSKTGLFPGSFVEKCD